MNRQVTVLDIDSLSGNFRLMDYHNDVVRAKDLLRGQGSLRLLKRQDAIRLTFFVPDSVRHLANLCCKVLLADVTNHLNCGGYVFGTP